MTKLQRGEPAKRTRFGKQKSKTSIRSAIPPKKSHPIATLQKADATVEVTEGVVRITLPFLTPGMNGPEGLIREQFNSRGKRLDAITMLLKAARPRGFEAISGPIEVVYIRYSTRLMDWDNACASFKHIGDALQHAKYLTDDSPKVIEEFTPMQFKTKAGNEKTVVLLRVIDPEWVKAIKLEFQ